VRGEPDFFEDPAVLADRSELSGGRRALPRQLRLELRPRLLLTGKGPVRVSVKLDAPDRIFGGYRFDPRDRIELRGHDGGADLAVASVRVSRGRLVASLSRVPSGAVGYKQLVIDQTTRGGARLRFDYVLRVVDKLRVALTFDDGPAACGDADDGHVKNSPTTRVLDALAAYRHGPGRARRGLKAAFFVLTGPERFLGGTYPKGETRDGRRLLERTAREGHVLAAHWGGCYSKQKYLHTSRVDRDGNGRDDDGDGRVDEDAAYDVDGDGLPDGACALESDLLHCVNRVEQVTGRRPEFVRPPLWGWRCPRRPELGRRVLASYRRLGLKPVLTDAKLGDGGYAVIGLFSPKSWVLKSGLRRAVAAGHAELVLTMHDSNRSTAGNLPKWLRKIEQVLGNINLGGRRIDPARDVQFASTRAELLEVLRAKRRFACDPHLPAQESPALAGTPLRSTANAPSRVTLLRRAGDSAPAAR
jgi:peptidoglycan/xylan/chitin deacetylase (PgdA/CDA1 family)